ncbi:MAG: histidine phosphatase family protein [Parcubacteria group bacterium]|nr:histidine phosphatase family protein [Parcubacteria group bacterium]
MSVAKRPKRLVLVRHGESEANKYLNQIIRGEILSYPPEFSKLRDWDIHLTPYGKEQALKTGQYLAKRFGIFDACFVSPQTRAKETMEEMVKGYGDASVEALRKKLRMDSRLREKDHGAINFLSQEEIKRFFPHEYERRQREGKFLYRALGGESWYDVKDLRVGTFLNTVYRDYAGGSVLIVSHSVVISCFRMKLEHLEENAVLEMVEKEPVENCGIAVFESDIGAGGRLLLREWNTIAYDRKTAGELKPYY